MERNDCDKRSDRVISITRISLLLSGVSGGVAEGGLPRIGLAVALPGEGDLASLETILTQTLANEIKSP